MIETKGRSLELFYIDGHPDGMITAELFNWTGHVFVTPRTRLTDALKREESGYAGVYLLLGEKERQDFAYIGEAEDLGVRLKQHAVASDKDWWETAVLISASANRLNKAHVKYLEARLVAMAREIGHTPLHNGNSPKPPGLTEADIAKMEAFLASLMVVLPAIRVDMFIQRSRPAGSTNAATTQQTVSVSNPSSDPVAEFTLKYPKYEIEAHAVLQDGEFIVLTGSRLYSSWQGKEGTGYHPLREELERGGVIKPEGKFAVFVKDYAFSSPSAAASIIYGRPANGQESWHEIRSGVTYKEWENRQLDALPVEDAEG